MLDYILYLYYYWNIKGMSHLKKKKGKIFFACILLTLQTPS